MSCWAATITNTMAAASIVSKITDKLSSLVCGVSLPATYDDGYIRLSPSSPEQPSRARSRPWSSSTKRVVSAPAEDDEEEQEEEEEDCVRTMSLPRVRRFPTEEATAVPCLAFPSQHGYKVFSLADMRMHDDGDVRLRPVLGRRLLPSPHGGMVLAADVCYRHPCHLVDPFTGEVTPLPDLPLPRSETEPVPCAPDEPRPALCARATDDGLAWDWSPRGVVVARGDTAFFLPAHGGGEWAPVHQSSGGSHMTVNHRGGRFFLLERRSLQTTVIDAATRRVCAAVPPPPGGLEDVDDAYLAPSAGGGDAILLVHRAWDRRVSIVTEAYRARLDRRPARWRRVEDVGNRAVFVDGVHGFTVRAGPRARRNHVYVTLAFQVGERAAAEYDVGVVNLRRPERLERVRLDAGEVERAWGWQPYWIIPNKGRLDSGTSGCRG